MAPLLTATAYFPPAAYIAACLTTGSAVIELHETWPKQTCRNHCDIAGPNGRQKLTVPVIKPDGNHTKTGEILIGYDLPWQKVHLRSILTAYNRSPFLIHYIDRFMPFFEKRYDRIVDLNAEILKATADLLGVPLEIGFTEGYVKSPANMADRRTDLVAKHRGHAMGYPVYTQPFTERYGFLENLSVLDLIFCLGPEAKAYLWRLLR